MDIYRQNSSPRAGHAEVIDGHDVAAVIAALDRARDAKGRPYAIIARTIKGHGVSFLADKDGWHGKALSQEQLEKALAEIGTRVRRFLPTPEVPMRGNSLPVSAGFPRSAPPDYALGTDGGHARGLRHALKKRRAR